jgi:hypothetical protein
MFLIQTFSFNISSIANLIGRNLRDEIYPHQLAQSFPKGLLVLSISLLPADGFPPKSENSFASPRHQLRRLRQRQALTRSRPHF